MRGSASDGDYAAGVLLAELELEEDEPDAAFAGAAAGLESDDPEEELDELDGFDAGIEDEPLLPSLRESVR